MKLEEYLSLPYTITLRPEEGVIVARVAELSGCSAHGETEAEAIENVREAQRLWIEDAIESGDPVPIPDMEEDVLPSGKWVQRAPRSLHKKLIQHAKKENVSLNQAVNAILSEAMGAIAERVKIRDLRSMWGGWNLVSSYNYEQTARNDDDDDDPGTIYFAEIKGPALVGGGALADRLDQVSLILSNAEKKTRDLDPEDANYLRTRR